MSQFVESGVPINFTADQIVSKAPGTLLGFYVNSTSSGTIVIYDGLTAAGGTAESGRSRPDSSRSGPGMTIARCRLP